MMNALLRWFGYEKRNHPRDPALARLFDMREVWAGVNVDETKALNYSSVYRAVSLISSSVSTLPLHVYERISDQERQRSNHPLDDLLNDSPNSEMDATTFRETLQAHVLTWGNGYAEIERDNGERLIGLHPISPDRVQPKRKDGRIVYDVRQTNGETKQLESYRVFHLKGLGSNGLVGYSPITLAANSIGLGMAAEEFGARFFGNGTHLGGLITRPQGVAWTDEAAKRFKDDFANWHQGLAQSHKIAVLEDGMAWQSLGVEPEAAQFLETRKFQVTEIARWFGVPPHLLYDLDRATFSNIEHQGLEFLNYCLRYWLKRWENACRRSLLSDDERQRYYLEHVTQELVRADLTTRYAAYSIGRNGGWLSVNDIRRAENMNPVEGGDEYLQPLNMTPADSQDDKPEAEQDALDEAERSLHRATLDRMIRVEANAIRRLAKKPAEFRAAVEDFYRSFTATLADALRPVLALQQARGKSVDLDAEVRRHVDSSKQQLLSIATDDTLPNTIDSIASQWESQRSQKEVPCKPKNAASLPPISKSASETASAL